MERKRTHKRKCPNELAKHMRDYMNVIRPTHKKKSRTDNTSCNNYSCDPNVELMAHLSLETRQITQPQESHSSGSHSPESHRNSLDSIDLFDLGSFLESTTFDPFSIIQSVPPAYCANSSTPMQDFLGMDNQNNIPPYSINTVPPNLAPFDQQQTINMDPPLHCGMNMNTNSFNSSAIVTPNPPVDTPLPDIVSPPLQSNLPDMPSRPNPPTFTNGPRYFETNPDFLKSFEVVDVDNSKFITFEELRVFLGNKDGTCFTNEAVMMIMGMFDKNKDYMIDINEFPEMLTFIKNWDTYFQYLDEDKSGSLDFREMNVAIKGLGLTTLSDTFITELIPKYVRPGDKRIHLDNFIVACVTLCRYKEGHQYMKGLFGNVGFDTNLEQFIAGSILTNVKMFPNQ